MLLCGFRLLWYKIRAMGYYGYAFSVKDALQYRKATTEEREMESYNRSVISPSLLNPDWADPTKFVFNPKFDLDVSDWLSGLPGADSSRVVPDEDGQANLVATPLSETVSTSSTEDTELGNNPPKRLRLSLSRKTQLSSVCPLKESTNQCGKGANHFAKPVNSPEREKAAKGVVPTNTEANTQWALRNFNAWTLNRSFVDSSEAVPTDLLQSHDAELVCKWLCRFLMETRKSDGSPYPPASLRSLICVLNRVLQSNKAPFSVVDKSDYRFRDLLKTLDSLSSELHRQGIGAVRHSAKVIA